MKKNYKTIGTISFVVIIGICSFISYISGGEKELSKNDTENMFVEESGENLEVKTKEIIVDVKGAVVNPNIYTLKEGSLIEDAINAAGGITEDAYLEGINRAEVLSSNEEVIVPRVGEDGTMETLSNSTSDKININKASSEELQKLNGIGPSKAADIIKYRETSGKFKNIEELKNVKGIGDASFEKIKDSIKV